MNKQIVVLNSSRITDTPLEMDALNADIAALNEEIAGYLAELNKEGISPAEKSDLRGLLNTRSQLLITLENRKTAITAGIRSGLHSWLCIFIRRGVYCDVEN
jgi:hypothetical protein